MTTKVRNLRATPACLSVLPLALFTAITTPAEAQTDQASAYIRTFLQRRNIPGASVAVIKDGKLVLDAGYGTASLELNVPATDQTVYEIG